YAAGLEYTAGFIDLRDCKNMLRMSAAFDYERFDQLFRQLGAAGYPAELHGHLVGRLSAGSRLDHGTWLDVAREVIDGRGGRGDADAILRIQLSVHLIARLPGSRFYLQMELPADYAPID